METTNKLPIRYLLGAFLACVLMLPVESIAQRLPHRGGNGRAAPAHRSAPARQAPSRQAPSRTKQATRQVPSRQQNTRQAPSHNNSRPTINGGSRKSNNRNSTSNHHTTPSRGGHNKVNVSNNKRGDVNINIDNSRHTVVRSNKVAYTRPPYRYGGRGFYCYHPYYYHPFRPFYWGPVWHPWGYFVASLATTAIIISIENQKYHYDQGVYYVESNGGYTVVQAPVGATIKVLPEGSQTVTVNETTNNYYYGGTYYEKSDGGYTVVPPTAGTVVENLPEGAEETRVGDQTYVKYGETYYQPVQVDGKNMYEVVEVKQE